MRQNNIASPPAIRFSRVRSGVLSELSLSVARGEIVSLLGSGAGPAAALAVLAGFARATQGEVAVDGFALDRTPPHRRGLGVVARPLALFPHLDVMAHARFAPGVSVARAEALLHHLDLSTFAGRRPGALAPEQQLRLALVRALAPAPAVLLLEDPFAALPPAARPGIKALLRALCAETGLSILHATDDVGAALGLSDRIGVMQAGRLLQIDTPRTLYEAPNSLAVAASLGPVNRLAGTKLDQEDDIARIRIAGGVVVEARCVDDIPDGSACVLTIRPDRIAVAAIAASEMGDGAIPAHLIESLFEGDHTRLRFALGEVGTAELIASRPASLPEPRGDAISLAWQPHHAHAFRPEAA